jgi:hypothetical protein
MWEADFGKITVPSKPRQKSLGDPISMEKSWAWWYTSVIPEMAQEI